MPQTVRANGDSPRLGGAFRSYGGGAVIGPMAVAPAGGGRLYLSDPHGCRSELCPARQGRRTDALRPGLAIKGMSALPPLTPGHQLLTDPDGRTVEVHCT